MNELSMGVSNAYSYLLDTGTLRLLDFVPERGADQHFSLVATRLASGVRLRAHPAPEHLSSALAQPVTGSVLRTLTEGESVTVAFPVLHGNADVILNGQPVSVDDDGARLLNVVVEARLITCDMRRAIDLLSSISADMMRDWLAQNRDHIRHLQRLRSPAAASLGRHIRTVAVIAGRDLPIDFNRREDHFRSLGSDARILAVPIALANGLKLTPCTAMYFDWLMEELINHLLEEVDPVYFARIES